MELETKFLLLSLKSLPSTMYSVWISTSNNTEETIGTLTTESRNIIFRNRKGYELSIPYESISLLLVSASDLHICCRNNTTYRVYTKVYRNSETVYTDTLKKEYRNFADNLIQNKVPFDIMYPEETLELCIM